MRHLERMRLGMALAGLLFCMTSTALAMSSGHKATATAAGAGNLATVCGVNFTDDGSLQWFQSKDATVPSIVLRPNQEDDFAHLSVAIGDARVVPNGHGTPVQTIVFYERTGQVDKLLYVTDTGLLYEPVSHHYFRPDSTVQAFLAEHSPE
jgi:hypothetical protein